jgi:excisionase family DNA binding protein
MSQAALQPESDLGAESLAMSFERVLNTEEAAALLQIHPKTLQRMARQRVVPAFRIGDLWRFRTSSLDQWLRAGLWSKSHSCRQCERKFRCSRARDISMEVLRRKNGRKERRYGSFATTSLMLGANDSARLSWSEHGRSIQPNPPRGRHRWYKRSCYGSMRSSRLPGAANFGAVIARYEQEEMPERYSTSAAYQSYIKNQIRPRWADTPMSAVKPMAVEDWLRNLTLAPKTKSHVRSLIHTIFQCAERWELIDKNPIKLVRVKGGTKRLKRLGSWLLSSSIHCCR